MDYPSVIHKKIILLGARSAGKTSLVTRLVEGRGPEPYLSTVGLKVDQKSLQVGDQSLHLTIWDLSGAEDVATLPSYYSQGCAGYLYVADLSRAETLRRLRHRQQRLARYLPGCPGLVVANKQDVLSPARLATWRQRLARQQVYLASARTGEGVDRVFQALAGRLLGNPPAK
jgi:hypothetical protein